jgi:hypothetical protein
MRCRLVPLLLMMLFHLSFNLCSTALTRRTSNCTGARGYRPSTARRKNVIRVLECLEHREPACSKRSSEEKRGSDERAQARQIARAKSWWRGATSTAPCKAKRKSLK